MRHQFLKTEIVKNNYAASPEPIVIKRQDYGYPEKAAIEPMGSRQNDAHLLAAIKARLKTEAKAGALFSPTRFEQVIGGQHGVLKVGRSRSARS